MDFSKIKGLTIPEGVVTKIMRGAVVLWEKIKASYTNLATTFETGRLSSSGAVKNDSPTATTCTDYIQFTEGSVVRIKGFGALTDFNTAVYGSSKNVLSSGKANVSSTYMDYKYDSASGIVTLTSKFYSSYYIRVSGVLTGTTKDVIITVNEPITESGASYTNLFDTNGVGFDNQTSKFYTNWIPYKESDNGGNGTIYHFKGLQNNAGYTNPYKMNFATDSNGSNATAQFYCSNANRMSPTTADYDSSVTLVQHQTAEYTYVRFEIREPLPSNLIITANEEIK